MHLPVVLEHVKGVRGRNSIDFEAVCVCVCVCVCV